MTRVLKAVGTQWRFVSNHDTVTHLTGRVVEIAEVYQEWLPWDYALRLVEGTPEEVAGTFVGIDRELQPLPKEAAA